MRLVTSRDFPAGPGDVSDDWHRVRRLIVLTGDQYFVLKEPSRGRLAIYSPYTDSLLTSTRIPNSRVF